MQLFFVTRYLEMFSAVASRYATELLSQKRWFLLKIKKKLMINNRKENIMLLAPLGRQSYLLR